MNLNPSPQGITSALFEETQEHLDVGLVLPMPCIIAVNRTLKVCNARFIQSFLESITGALYIKGHKKVDQESGDSESV